MKNKSKFSVYLSVAIVFITLSVVIFIMADGLRRWYSGTFFLILGGALLTRTLIQNRKEKEVH